jgi:ATP-dependent Clp protease ATP-binding subunit ClpX
MTKQNGSGDSKNTLYCSFCGKSQHEVQADCRPDRVHLR